ncbi:MAG: tyrosine-type recombinase/integrase [Candidatus Nanopelagicales bacterium]
MSVPGPQLLPEAIAEFLLALRTAKPSPHTLTAYEADLRLVAVHFPGDPAALTVGDLQVRNLQRAFAAYADTHAKASTSRAWSTWNRLCDHLVVTGQLPGNPMAAVGKPRVPKSVPHAFTDADMARLIQVVRAGVQGRAGTRPWPERDFALFATLSLTGLRRAELLALTLTDIEGNPGQRHIVVRHGKGDKYRAIPIDAALESVVTDYLRSRWARFPTPGRGTDRDPWWAAANTALWLGDQGRALTTGQLTYLTQRAFRQAAINANRPSGALVHALRHTFATTLLENGASAVEVMGLLGHASLATTQRYLATRPEYLRSAVAANPVYRQLQADPE